MTRAIFGKWWSLWEGVKVVFAGVLSSRHTLISARMTSTLATDVTCARLLGVQGAPDKNNDVVFCGKYSERPQNNVVFVGGDIQDFSENMLAHRDSKHYEKWNLESTAQLLHQKYPSSHIWVIKPCHMQLKTFSVFSNFVTSSAMGHPEHGPNQGAWLHLRNLLKNAAKKISTVGPSSNVKPQGSRPPAPASCESPASCEPLASCDWAGSCDVPVTIIGFSKGCVVLNQFLYELQDARQDPQLSSFIQQVKHMYWLDGGHSGGSNTWIVHEHVLKGLIGSGIEVHCHVTPYQIRDVMRKWIGKEQKKFVKTLGNLNVKVHNTVHFEEEDRSLDNHFKTLEIF